MTAPATEGRRPTVIIDGSVAAIGWPTHLCAFALPGLKVPTVSALSGVPPEIDTEKLLTELPRFGMSNLRNPALATPAFHILPYQGMGSGIPRAIEDWRQIEFADDRQRNQFRVTLKRTDAQAAKVSEKTSGKVLAALRADPAATIAKLASHTGVTTRSIERTLNKLQQQNRLVRVGAAKGGHWKVLGAS
jgi:predicted HTH transcriptional regulator